MTRRTVPTPLRRSFDRFMSNPGSVRNAAQVMIIATVVIVLIGGLIVWVFDSRDFPDYGSALWYALQTVTTVGYGDKVPTDPVGRMVGAFVMITAVALVAIVTASITSTFVEAAQRRHRQSQQTADKDSAAALEARLDEVVTRLSAIERSLAALATERGPAIPGEPPPGTSPAAEPRPPAA